jgi:hypothetical protein
MVEIDLIPNEGLTYPTLIGRDGFAFKSKSGGQSVRCDLSLASTVWPKHSRTLSFRIRRHQAMSLSEKGYVTDATIVRDHFFTIRAAKTVVRLSTVFSTWSDLQVSSSENQDLSLVREQKFTSPFPRRTTAMVLKLLLIRPKSSVISCQ